MQINWEEVSFGIITYSGTARSCGMLAIEKARNGKFEEAYELLNKGNTNIIEAEKMHLDIIKDEAQGVLHEFHVLFMHAEDQMMVAQLLLDLTKEIIELNKKIK